MIFLAGGVRINEWANVSNCIYRSGMQKAMQLNEPIQYFSLRFESSIEFEFLPQMGVAKYTAPNVAAWFEQIRKNQVTDVKLLCPYSVKDRGVLGFSNTTESSILCFHRSGKVTYFVPN
mgnify:CR=1 FL=1